MELCHIFSNVVAFAEKDKVFGLVKRGRLLEGCEEFITIDDAELVYIGLYLIKKIIELGDYFTEDCGNVFINEIKMSGLKGKILEKTYNDNPEINSLSS